MDPTRPYASDKEQTIDYSAPALQIDAGYYDGEVLIELWVQEIHSAHNSSDDHADDHQFFDPNQVTARTSTMSETLPIRQVEFPRPEGDFFANFIFAYFMIDAADLTTFVVTIPKFEFHGIPQSPLHITYTRKTDTFISPINC